MSKEILIEKFENDVKKRTRFMRFLLVLDQIKIKVKSYYTLQEFGDWLRVYRHNYK